MPGPQGERIIRIEIEIEIRPGVGTAQTSDRIPRAAHLQSQAPANKSPRSQLYRRLYLQIFPDINRCVRTRPRLGSEAPVRVHSNPRSRVVPTPPPIEV